MAAADCRAVAAANLAGVAETVAMEAVAVDLAVEEDACVLPTGDAGAHYAH